MITVKVQLPGKEQSGATFCLPHTASSSSQTVCLISNFLVVLTLVVSGSAPRMS